MGYWVVFSTHWSLEDLQAGLNVVIQVLCILTIFAGVQWLWQSNAIRIARGETMSVARVLSVTTPGEVWDLVALLRSKIFNHKAVLTQSLLVVVLGLIAIFSGPVARFNTHKGMATPEREVNGFIATRSFECLADDTMGVRDVWESLDNAKFPQDRLLDWLPDINADWQYNPDNWRNSTWSAECIYTPQTNITLSGTGMYNGSENWPAVFYELEGLWKTLDEDFKNNGSISTSGGGNNRGAEWLNLILWIYAVIIDETDMEMSLVSTYLEQPPAGNATEYALGIGLVPKSYYTKASCHFHRTTKTIYQAFPDAEDNCIAQQAATYFFSNILRSVVGGIQIHLPTGEEIFRWYQSYTIEKDTYYKHPNKRLMEVSVETVEVSAIFLALGSLITLFVLVGLARYAVFRWKYGDIFKNVPETKVDWVLYSHKAKGRKGLNSMYGSNVELALRGDNPWNISRWSLNRLDTACRPLNDEQKDEGLERRKTSNHESLETEAIQNGTGGIEEGSIV